MSDQQPTRGAAEDNSATPLTETEVEASRRPPSQPPSGRDNADDTSTRPDSEG